LNVRGKLYPAVSFGVTQTRACISVNFGSDDNKPLLYKASSDDEATYKLRRFSRIRVEDENSVDSCLD
jgi:hypothetical protein